MWQQVRSCNIGKNIQLNHYQNPSGGCVTGGSRQCESTAGCLFFFTKKYEKFPGFSVAEQGRMRYTLF